MIYDRLKIDTDNIVQRAIQTHGDTYTYNNTVWVNSQTKIIVTCREHGDFEILPHNHIKGCGCMQCGIKKSANAKKASRGDTIKKFKARHGDKYDYSLVEEKGTAEKVSIICPKPGHGVFSQEVGNHTQGQGCPKCANVSRMLKYHNSPARLYYIRVGNLYKIGVTKYTVKRRYAGQSDVIPIWEYLYDTGKLAYEQEQEILSTYAHKKYTGPDVLNGGNSELFTEDVLGLDIRSYHE